MWSEMLTKNGLKVHKTIFREKKIKTKKNRKLKLQKRLQSLVDSGDQTTSFGRFLRPYSQNNFPYRFFLFSTLNSKMSGNMCKMCHKNLPHESPNCTNLASQIM